MFTLSIRRLTSIVILAALGLGGLGVAGCAAAAAPSPPVPGPAHVSVVVHPTQLEFLSTPGASSQPPHGPLAVGDRVLGEDDLLQAGAVIGHDDEVCTFTFDRHVLCDDMLSFFNQGDLHVTWAFQWPASGTSGPSTFEGIVEGGTGAYRNARGGFRAVTLVNRDLQITAIISR